MQDALDKISLSQALGARKILRPFLSPTPLRSYPSLNRLIGAEVFVKHENQNLTGTFKIRGSLNLMHNLNQEPSPPNGVITYSTGNHGISVATSAQKAGLQAVVVVPEDSNPVKIQAIRDAGAELIEHGANFEEAGRKVVQLQEERGLYFVHPANEPHLINGVATEFLEILEQVPDLDVLIIPIGAGSEAAAAVTVCTQVRPQVEIIAVQAEAAPAACYSWREQRLLSASNTTFAGGVATGTAYELPFLIYKNQLADFILLSEEELYEGIALTAHHTRNLAEGAGASCLRAAVKIRERLQGKKVAIQMSGGNAAAKELTVAMSLPCLESGVVE